MKSQPLDYGLVHVVKLNKKTAVLTSRDFALDTVRLPVQVVKHARSEMTPFRI